MTWFLQSINLDVWDVIEDEPNFPSKLVDGVWFQNPSKNEMSVIKEISN